MTQVLPWWFKRYVLFQKGAVCPELYKLEKHSSETASDNYEAYNTEKAE